MARYIDADAFEKQLNRYVEYNDDGEQEINADNVFITLHEQPTADVVGVVRCKDCIFGYSYYDVQNGITDSWVECKNPDGLNRDVSVDGYCCASIRRRSQDGEIY